VDITSATSIYGAYCAGDLTSVPATVTGSGGGFVPSSRAVTGAGGVTQTVMVTAFGPTVTKTLVGISSAYGRRWQVDEAMGLVRIGVGVVLVVLFV
jgi:hypothetical protein